MNFFVTAFLINFKKVMGNKSIIFIMLVLPVFIFICASFFSKNEMPLQIKVGIAFDEADSISQQIFDHMSQAKGIELKAFHINEAVQLENMVKKQQLECGYIIDPQIFQKIEEDDYKHLVSVIKSPASVADAIINEMVYTAVLKAASPHITAKTLQTHMGADYIEAKKAVIEDISRYDQQDIFVNPNNVFENNVINNATNNYNPFYNRILKGLIGLFVLIFILFISPMFIAEKKQGILTTMSLNKRCQYYLSVFFVIFLLNVIFCLASLFVIKAIYPLAIINMTTEIAMLCHYIAAMAMVSVFFICLLKTNEIIYSGFIFIILLNLLFGGILLDLNEISPLLGNISRGFLTNYYLNGVLSGNMSAAIVLDYVALALACGIICVELNTP